MTIYALFLCIHVAANPAADQCNKTGPGPWRTLAECENFRKLSGFPSEPRLTLTGVETQFRCLMRQVNPGWQEVPE